MNKYIKEYLLQNNKLPISNFGIFEIVYKSSEIHPILHTFTAPGKYVIFQENNTVSSDEFSDFIAVQEQITKEEAIIRINQWVEKIRKITTSKEEYPLSTLGKFTLNAMDKIEFISLLDTDISPESLGLENFTATIPSEIKKERKEETAPEGKEIKQELPIASTMEIEEKYTDIVDSNEIAVDEIEPKKTKRRRPVLIILVTLLILAFCGVLAIGITYHFYPQTLQNHCETLYTFIQDKADAFGIQGETTDKIENSSEDDIFSLEDQYIQPDVIYTENISGGEQPEIIGGEATTTITPAQETPKQDVVKTGSYYVVMGSFKEIANAEDFEAMKKLEYPNVVNLGLGIKSQLYMIAIGPYSQAEAEQQVKNITNGWVLKK